MEQISKNISVKSPFETEKITKLISKFAIPCIISLVVNALYNIVDQIFIGQGVGYLGNAATNVVFPMTVIATAFAVLIGDGAAAYMSLKLGDKRKDEASKGVGNAIVSIFFLGAVFLVVGILLRNPLLNLFGQTQAIETYCVGYMKYIVIGLPFMMIVTSLNSIIRADGSPKYAMFVMLIGAILNIILDPIFIFKLQMGVKGAAIATVIGQVVSFIVGVFYIRRFKTVDVNKHTIMPKFSVIANVVSLGVSSFITQVAITIVIIVMNNSLKYYGASSKYGSEIPLSALGIVMKVNQILTSIFVGIGAGSQPIIGFNYGAKNYLRVKKTYLTSVSIAIVIGIIGFCIFQIFPQYIVNIFGQAEGLYNEFALKCFHIFLMLCMCNGFQIVTGIFFQAIGKPLQASIMSLSRQIIFFIPAVLISPRIFGLMGVLYAGPIADGLACTLSIILICIQMKKITKKQNEEDKLKDSQNQEKLDVKN